MSRRLLLALVSLATLAGAVAPAVADVHPNTAGGFPVEQSFHIGDIDNVNLFNGSLTLTLPLGPSFPVNGGFSYGLKLVYNSSPWFFQTIERQVGLTPRTQASPTPCSNAGLGWRVSLGRMDPPCQVPDDANDSPLGPIYQDEMGTDHIFYATLHEGDPEDAPIPGVQDVQYTRDGSYLRLKTYTAGFREVESPDGTVRTFDASGLPTQIRDPFGNFLTINYVTGINGADDRWILRDSQNRVQTVFLHTDSTSHLQLVDLIQWTAFGNTTAAYTFGYDYASLWRSCPHNDTDQNGLNGVSDAVTVPLLTRVTLPDGSAFQAMVNDYLTVLNTSQVPGGHCANYSGNLKALTLPTLGRLEWTWQTFQFPSGSTVKIHLQSNPGVATRTLRDAGGAVLGTWTYVQSADQPFITAREVRTTITDPLGNRTVNYFSTGITDNRNYSLAFSPLTALHVPPNVDLHLSRQTFQGSSPAPLRSEYVLYELDPGSGTSPHVYNTNRRQVHSRTVYEDDGTWAGVVNSAFDGLGHYRQQDTEGSFPGSNARTHFANFNPAQGNYVVNPAANSGTGFNVWPSNSAWVLETMTHTAETENGATAWTDLCYAPGTAAVIRRRVHRLDGATRSPNDLVTAYDLTAQGNVSSEKSYGGDAPGGIPAGDLCTMTLPGNPQYQLDHTYAFGVRTTSQYAGASFLSLNQSVDPTGLVSFSQDTAGVGTAFVYDALGRRTWTKPAQSGWTQYLYSPASPFSKANVTVRQRDNGSESAPILAVSQIVFDDFGRVFQELRQLPDGGTGKRQTTYDGAGNKATVSEMMTGSPNSVTAFLNYDPFGRPGIITPPDGAAHNVTLTYHGVRQVDRTVQIGTSFGGESPATTSEVYDRQGRLLSVTEPSGSGGSPVTTTYGYDVGNRLTSVATLGQSRGFLYDRAGLLQSETHPEKGLNGNGTVSYPSYDSRGHALQKIDGANDLSFVYDFAERLLQVNETNGRPLKVFTYAPANGGNDLRLGKLRQASRYNYTPFGTARIDETYTYGGRDGRVSRRDTASSTGESFTQSFSYNALGLSDTLTYPACTHTGCTQPAAAVFADVPTGYWAQREIEGLYSAKITGGCGGPPPLRYCPDDGITRAQMAVFLVRGMSGSTYTPPICTSASATFVDVPCSYWAADWIYELFRRGITGGCGNNHFCPDDLVTHAQMSVFLLRSREGGSYVPPPCVASFADVNCPNHWAANWISEISRRGIDTGCGGGNFCPDAPPITRAQMAGLLDRTFDLPIALDPNTTRTVQNTYAQGLLTGVSAGATTYGTISYYPNLLVSQVVHGNGMVETQGNDPNSMRRPASEGATGPYATWSSGAYSYDGAGNITHIGPSWYTYDLVSRLTSGTLYDGPTGGGNQKTQGYAFDPFGNLTNITGTSGRATPTDSVTNRLNGTGTQYDAAGNLTHWNGAVYNYDRFNQMTEMTSGNEHALYVYTADDERVWSYDLARNLSHWTLRDLGGKVLRDYVNDSGTWSLGTDYLHRDGLLLAAETQTGQRHYHLDHLGTPRLITRGSGYLAAYHVYYPFGEEATAFNQDTERMKFTGDERDLASPAGAGDDLDYMHARFFNPLVNRFTSVDPIGGNPRRPQSWNLYSYVTGNPVRYTDPDGRLEVHQPAPVGMTLGDYWGIGFGMTVIAPAWRGTTTNPNTGVWGLSSLISGGTLFHGLSDFSLGRSIRDVRGYYLNRFNQMAGEGNDFAALVDWVGLELVIPTNSRDLGIQLAMA
ncbi:MAG: S-layer homology domain-containing protein, partial [Acidobacteria bacterium]|nr:S-layer homology domain-containing protein [Acidobacteriota bacterium]